MGQLFLLFFLISNPRSRGVLELPAGMGTFLPRVSSNGRQSWTLDSPIQAAGPVRWTDAVWALNNLFGCLLFVPKKE